MRMTGSAASAGEGSEREQQIKIAARLYECRDAARFLLGARYATALTPWRALISDQMARAQMSVSQAVLYLGERTPVGDGAALLLMMAAAVEMIEEPPEIAPERHRAVK